MATAPVLGWVLYDDSCGFCRRWIPFWQTTLKGLGFGIARLQDDWVRQRLNVPDDELLADLRLLMANGEQVRGANVYRYMLQRIWWAWPLYVLSILPLGRQAFDWGYRTFARNRFWVSQVCRMPAGNAP